MGFIKSVLSEELDNSLKMLEGYRDSLKSNQGGCLVKKKIRGRVYWYLAIREGRKVNFIYKGKNVSRQDLAALEKAKAIRKKHKELIQDLNKRVKYLRKSLRGKEDV
jgi:hypothetical protein